MLLLILNINSHLVGSELWGIASRTDYDLRQHSEHSGEDFKYHDPETNENTFLIVLNHLLVQIV